ncbi:MULTISPECIES: SusE domain-containing protein [unclassified Chryseobacterium]|uniref:SusE domain-containing protein n=1 Tax=unclassified Chryseobacterium TaxID=2593645 RepID=UPI00210F131A|nr:MULTISPECIES: SusE domain-containing protein [unclassified Chryseobacterium]MCQ4140027.1 SusE domain-containing protein [Chryseobacterium sp. EO14]MCY1661446.1 SusE domain-containing protein [Chryseobacterium sp. SL1]
MKNIIKFLFAAIAIMMVWSCDKDEDQAVLSLKSEPNLKASTNALSLSSANANNNAITFTITPAEYTPSVEVTNVLQFAVTGTNFASVKEAGLSNGVLSKSYTVIEFNALMLNLGLPTGVASNVDVRLKTTVGKGSPVYSQIQKISVTPYALVSYMYAPGAYQGWDPPTAQALKSATSNGIYIGYINFTSPNSEFKITPMKNWDHSYGSNNNVDLIYDGGGNLKAVNAGSQKLTVNTNTNKFTLAPYSWAVIGSATPNGWNDPDTDLVWNSTTEKWEVTVVLTVGEIKFRLNNDWGTNFGDDGNNGTLDAGGANIPISLAGTYKITFDEVNLVYTAVKL